MSLNPRHQFVQSILKIIYNHQANGSVHNALVGDLYHLLRRCSHEHCLSSLKRSLQELLSSEVSLDTQTFVSEQETMAEHIYYVLYAYCPSVQDFPVPNVAAAIGSPAMILRGLRMLL